ncbi:MAG: hypothetical protein IJT08_01215, partial [Alphaproteobacteria bacterium]|nr:hypothetical protein [Alphaproteobacteria bacterium]
MNVQGGVVITKLKRALYLSTSILIAQGIVFDCRAETETAASVVGNLLSSAANAVTHGQAKQNEAQDIMPSADKQSLAQPPQSIEDETTTGTSNVEPAATSTVSAVPSLAMSLEMPGVAPTTTPTSIEQPTPAVATAPASLDATQKRVGFIDSEGNVLIAPKGSVFPNEMLDGQLYFFSRDVDALKRQIADSEQNGMPNGQMMPGNGSAPGQMQPNGQYVPQGGMPNGRIMPGNGGVPGQMQPNGQYAPQGGMPNGQTIPGNGGIPG